MPRERNSQFGKFWKAQSVLDSIDRPFKTKKGMTTYIRKATDRAFLRRRYPELAKPIHIEFLPKFHREKGSSLSVSIPENRMNMHCVLYCLTRVIWCREARKTRGGTTWAYNGWQWAAIYLDVVQSLMGKEAADLLKSAYSVYRVRWKPKKKVEVTDEMLERLAAARAKRKAG
jgi:hypothetical protein